MEKGVGHPRLRAKEFVWDSFIIFLVVMMISLVAIDVGTELVRESHIVCTPSNITNSCATSAPAGAYISSFILLHSIVILSAHYLWRYHHENLIDLFYGSLNSFQNSNRAIIEISDYNIELIRHLEKMLTSRNIFQYYVLKLLFQFLWVIGGLIFVTVYFWETFTVYTDCSFTITSDFSCVYSILTFLRVLWMLEIIFLFFSCITLVWAIIWCFDIHCTELGSDNIALFCYHYGLSSKCYKSRVALSPRFSCVNILCSTIPLLQRFMYSGPHIVHGLDFLVMNLFHSSSPFGTAFKELQIKHHYQELCKDEQRRLNVYTSKQRNILTDDNEGIYYYDGMHLLSYKTCQHYTDEGVLKTKDLEIERMELMWNFRKKSNQQGIYDDYELLSPQYPIVSESLGVVYCYICILYFYTIFLKGSSGYNSWNNSRICIKSS